MNYRSYGKKEEVYGYETYWRELGNHLLKLELYQKSLKIYDLAVLKNPTDRRALLARSIARGRTGHYQEAAEDVNKALDIDSNELIALAEKAHIAYLNCEFEESLLQNSRLLSKRRKPENFYIGKMNCCTAIETCLGEGAGRPLRDHFYIIRNLAWKNSCESEKLLEPQAKVRRVARVRKHLKLLQTKHQHQHEIPSESHSESQQRKSSETEHLSIKSSLHSYVPGGCTIPPYSGSIKYGPLQKYTNNVENYIASKYLDTMCHEKSFLKDIQNMSGLISPNQKGVKRIKELAKDCFSNVSHKQEVLRARRPFYYIKYQEAHLSGTLKARQKEDLTLQQLHIKKESEKILAKLRYAAEKKNLSKVLEVAEKLKIFCDSKPKRLLPGKHQIMKEVYQKLRSGFYELNRLNSRLSRWDQDKRIYVSLGKAVSREPSTDSVMSQYGKFVTDSKHFIKLYTRRLKNAQESNEICCCYHELARFHMELKIYDMARANARKCINVGKVSDIPEWVINGLMLLLRIHMREQNRNDAIADVKEALVIGQELNDQRLISYLNRCLAVIHVFEFDEMNQEREIEKRERHIVELMSNNKLKNEFAHLFNLMSALPSNRRMSVMPGVRLNSAAVKTSKATLVNTAKAISSQSITSRKSNRSLKTTSSDQESFMALVQFHV